MPQKFDLIAIGRAAVDLNAVEYNRPLEDTICQTWTKSWLYWESL